MDVVAVFERVDDLERLSGPFGVDFHLHGGDELDLGGVVFDSGVLDGRSHGDDVAVLAVDRERLASVLDFLDAGLEHRREDVVLAHALGGNLDDSFAGEHVGHRAGVGELPAVAGQGDAHFGRGAVAIVRQAFDEDGDAARGVALVGDRLIVDRVRAVSRASLDRAIDVVRRNRVAFGLLNGVEEGGVARGVASARASGDFDVLDQAGEEFASLGVVGSLLVLGRGPLRVS